MWHLSLPWWEFVLRGLIVSPQVLLHNGRIYEKALHDAQLTREELMSALRSEGFSYCEDVRAAILENDGSISVISYHNLAS
ncbi:MAG: DUF421 domain-containing protein [Verrucomicrobia bacterium]|nr:DUF421 domain-containing protein [Verrucomicrobiota bacterium]